MYGDIPQKAFVVKMEMIGPSVPAEGVKNYAVWQYWEREIQSKSVGRQNKSSLFQKEHAGLRQSLRAT